MASKAEADELLLFKDPGAKVLVTKLFGEELGKELALFMGRGKSLEWRKVLEPIDAVDQCNNTVGDVNEVKKPCYLCGQMPDKKRKFTHPLFAECEHILPVTTARWFLTLYMNKEQKKDEWVQGMLNVEYAWAHRVCNQTKSNSNFLKKDDQGTPIVDRDTINEVLMEIGRKAKQAIQSVSPTPEDKGKLEAIAQLETAAIRQQRIESIIANNLTPILNALKTFPPEDNLLLLARTTALMDTSFLSKGANDIVSNYYAKMKDEGNEENVNKAANAVVDIKDTLTKEITTPINTTNLPDFVRSMLPAGYDNNVFEILTSMIDRKFNDTDVVVDITEFPPEAKAAVEAEWNALSNGGKLEPLIQHYGGIAIASMLKELDPGSSSSSVETSFKNIDLTVAEFCSYHLTNALWKTLNDEWKRAHPRFTCRLIAIQQVSGTYVENFIDKKDFAVRMAEHVPYKDLCPDIPEEIVSDEDWEIVLRETKPTPEEISIFKKQGKAPEVFATKKDEDIHTLYGEITTLKQEVDRLAGTNAQAPKKRSLGKKIKEIVTILEDQHPTNFTDKQIADMLAELKPQTGTARRTRRAKLSQRTKRARRSGPSTKLRRRSFRKSQTGKLTKRSRY